MYEFMPYQMAPWNECFITYVTNIRTFTTMYEFMPCQMAPWTECFITYSTGIRALTTMYVLFYKTTLLNKCPITHITLIWLLTTMYVLMSDQIPLFTECLITHFIQIWILTPMYITVISALITMYTKFFIQCSLVKKNKCQTLRYIFIEKTIIFVAKCTFIINPTNLKNWYLQKGIGWLTISVLSLQIKHQLFHLSHTYFRVLCEMHSATFHQQLRNIMKFEGRKIAPYLNKNADSNRQPT